VLFSFALKKDSGILTGLCFNKNADGFLLSVGSSAEEASWKTLAFAPRKELLPGTSAGYHIGYVHTSAFNAAVAGGADCFLTAGGAAAGSLKRYDVSDSMAVLFAYSSSGDRLISAVSRNQCDDFVFAGDFSYS
jgi:hypothetical protein